MRLFQVPPDDLGALQHAHEAVCREPALAAWVATAAERLRAVTGRPSPGPSLEPRPGAPDDVAAYLPVLVLARQLPALLRHHRALGVPPEVTADTLADVGRMLGRNRVWEGAPGLGEELAGWLTRHLGGALYQLGRLQYERLVVDRDGSDALRESGLEAEPGTVTLNLHVPHAGGPLAPEVVDASLARARAFFGEHLPGERYAALTCHSWLLDPQLAEYLPADANLVRFQQRFTRGPPRLGDGDASVRRFVFGDTTTPLEALPQRTTLERAAVTHLRAGRHWQVASGWLPWP